MTDSPGFVSSVRLVARREFVERVRERSFAISTAITLLILVGVIVLPPLFGAGRPTTYDVAFGGPSGSATAKAALAQAHVVDVHLRSRPVPADPRAALESGEVDAVVNSDQVAVKEALPDPLAGVLQAAHQQVSGAAALTRAGIDPDAVEAAFTVVRLRVQAVSPKAEDADARQAIAFISVVVLYSQLIGYGFWVALGVVEEKSSRVVEVLLAAVRPRALLTGKIIGIGLLGLMQLVILAAAGLAAGAASGALKLEASIVGPVVLVLPWFLMGYAFYACVFAAAAARVSRQEDLQNSTTPLTLVIMVSFFAAFYATGHPDALLSQVLSVLPPFSALVSPPRAAAGAMPGWQVALAVALMLLATAGLVRVAARLYEGAILRIGATVSWKDAWAGGRH